LKQLGFKPAFEHDPFQNLDIYYGEVETIPYKLPVVQKEIPIL
jgi:hypothetical protein